LFSMQRTIEQQAFTQDELKQLNRLVPYIRQAVQLHQQTTQYSDSLAAVIDAIPQTTIVLSDQGSIIHANKSAQELLKSENCIYVEDNRLNFTNADKHFQFVAEHSACISASMGLQSYSTSTLFISREDKADLIVCLAPIEGISQHRGGAMVNVYDPMVRQLPTATLIAEYFSLTQAEALLCEDLINGYSLQQIADLRNKSLHTLRSYLKVVFEKTGFNRQGQLVSSILAALMH